MKGVVACLPHWPILHGLTASSNVPVHKLQIESFPTPFAIVQQEPCTRCLTQAEYHCNDVKDCQRCPIDFLPACSGVCTHGSTQSSLREINHCVSIANCMFFNDEYEELS